MKTREWSTDVPGRTLALDAAGWAELTRLYADRLNNEPLLRCFQVAQESGARTAVVETRYVGPDFRREYSSLHSKTFRYVPDCAHRIHFFGANLDIRELASLPADCDYLGYVTVRPPRLSAVAKAMLVPPPSLRKR